MSRHFFTSESVTKGHPDKVCDQISDAILDAMLQQDPQSRVACETTCTTGVVSIMGEITTKAQVESCLRGVAVPSAPGFGSYGIFHQQELFIFLHSHKPKAARKKQRTAFLYGISAVC